MPPEENQNVEDTNVETSTTEASTENIVSEELSIEDQVRVAYEDMQEKEKEDPSEYNRKFQEELDEEEDEAELEKERDKAEAELNDEPLEPPSDWGAEGKESFRKLPKETQIEVKAISDEYQRWRRAEIRQLTDARKFYEDKAVEIEPAIKTIRTFLPRWAAQGLSVEAAFSKMCAFNDLVVTDGDLALESLAKALGKEIEIKNRKKSENSENRVLQTQNFDVRSEVQAVLDERQRVTSIQNFATHIDEVFNGLKNEVNGEGKYLYPDLHSAQIESEIAPIVERLLGSNPNLHAREAILRAYKAIDGRVIPQIQRDDAIPNRTVQRNNLAVAKRAASSVSGSRGGVSQNTLQPARPGESVEESVARTYDQMFNSRN